ncbi:MAG: hypothetical protein IT459_23230 [Planctomycetes bacterium]|nr:hypothetical protein [Planctomycetota bacterium]
MNRRIPPEAFDYYLNLGVQRSYQAVAEKFGVSKVAIVACAKREDWQTRIERIESSARATHEKRAIESREEMHERYLKYWEAVERRALEALRNFPFDSAMDAARALDLAMKNTRLIRGEPTERTSIEELIKRETATLLEAVEEPDDDAEGGQASAV